MRAASFGWVLLLISVAMLVISALHRHSLSHSPAFWIVWCAAFLVIVTVILYVAIDDDERDP